MIKNWCLALVEGTEKTTEHLLIQLSSNVTSHSEAVEDCLTSEAVQLLPHLRDC